MATLTILKTFQASIMSPEAKKTKGKRSTRQGNSFGGREMKRGKEREKEDDIELTLREQNDPTRLGRTILEVEKNDELDEAVRQDGSKRDSDEVLVLLPPVSDVGGEGEELEEHMEDGDEDGGDEEDGVGFDQHPVGESKD